MNRINQEPECRRSTSVLFRHYGGSSASCLLACLLEEAGSTKDSLVTSRRHHYRIVSLLGPISCYARSVTSFVDPLMVSIRFNVPRTRRQREETVMSSVL